MKVLFAFNNDGQVNQLVDFYKKTYGEKLEVTKVFFFKALLDTIRKNKNFDRIVIHEEVEPFGTRNQDAIDKYLFNNLDKVSDEAGKADIIVVCSEKRQQNDKFVKTLFNLGIYNILTGQDRTFGNVSELINKPRTKKEAKMFVDADLSENPYEANDKVDELELRNIIRYFEKNIFSKEKIVAAFESLYEQYTFDKIKEQIVPVIPLKAREVLEQNSQRYVTLMAYKPPKGKRGETVKIIEVPVYIQQDSVKKPDEPPIYKNEPRIEGPTGGRVKMKYDEPKVESTQYDEIERNPIVEQPKIEKEEPSKTEMPKVEVPKIEMPSLEFDEKASNVKKFDEKFSVPTIEIEDGFGGKAEVQKFGDVYKADEIEDKKKVEEERAKLEEEAKRKAEEEKAKLEEETKRKAEEERAKLEEEAKRKAEEERAKLEEEAKRKAEEERVKLEEEVKRKAEEERAKLEEEAKRKAEEEKAKLEEEAKKKAEEEKAKLEEEAKRKAEEERAKLEEEAKKKAEEERVKLEEAKRKAEEEARRKLEEDRQRQEAEVKRKAEEERLRLENEAKKKAEEERAKREFEAKNVIEPEVEIVRPASAYVPNVEQNSSYSVQPRYQPPRPMPEIQKVTEVITKEVQVFETPRDYKKAVCFVGAHKTGTTFIINAIANVLAGKGVKVAILDLTNNKDTYLIYTNRDLDQKDIAANGLNNLAIGQDRPFKLGNLSIYTGIPRTTKNKLDVYKAIEIAKREHSVVLIDCDFSTKKDVPDVFRYAQSIYVVQDMDTLNILPITMFLKELKNADIAPEKISVIINKYMKSSVKVNDILGSLAFYTSPDFSVMEENLLPKDVKKFTVPFDEQNYLRYIENVSTCRMNFSGFSEEFKQAISLIIQDVFPISGRAVQRQNADEGGFIKGIFKKR